MKRWQRTILVICCLLGMGISFMYYYTRINSGLLYNIKAPVHLNIEIDKAYVSSVSIFADFFRGEDVLLPLSAEVSNEIRTVILYSEMYNSLTQELFLRVPKETAQETLNAIDGISVFIGNKAFYFSNSDVTNLEGKEQSDYLLYELPGLEYKKSATAALLKLPPWLNWYGDFSMAVEATLAFFIRPRKFIVTWCFLICLLILCRTTIENIYSVMRKKKELPELALLGLIVLSGFVLRLNGYVRYSSWVDELYSACQASNPSLPFMNTFEDPGNPPFYFILLRIWFTLFGWTEQSGRFFSVLTGSAAIISLYILVKQFANKKSALMAASYMAVSGYLIGFSQEMRGYILEVFLVSIVAFRFLVIIKKKELNLINLVWYVIPSVLLVNTHYYGSLFVFVSFLFFIAYSVRAKAFTWKKTVLFFTGNLLIMFSLLPYFIHTALNRALLNSNFNTWIPKPGLQFVCMAAFIFFSGVFYFYLRKDVFSKIIFKAHGCFLDYIVFTIFAVYLIAFGISLYRPILIQKYLVILYPLLIAGAAIIFMDVLKNSSKLIGSLCICFTFSLIIAGYEAAPGGGKDVYHESLAYISRDAEAHPQIRSVETGISPFMAVEMAHFYGYKQLPLYVNEENYDVLYFNPLHRSKESIYSEIVGLGISPENVLQIRINNSSSVFKIYAPR